MTTTTRISIRVKPRVRPGMGNGEWGIDRSGADLNDCVAGGANCKSLPDIWNQAETAQFEV